MNGGYDRILDFVDDEDKIQIEGFDFGDVTITNESNGAVIDYGGGEIKLTGVDASLISESDFLFV